MRPRLLSKINLQIAFQQKRPTLRRVMKKYPLITLCLFSLASIGCEKSKTSAGSSSDETVVINGAEYTFSAEEVKSVPAEFPKDIYLPSDHRVFNVNLLDSPGSSEKMIMLTVISGLDPKVLDQELQASLQGSGWKTHPDSSPALFIYTKEAYTLRLSVQSDASTRKSLLRYDYQPKSR
jgi:hypothetical protein